MVNLYFILVFQNNHFVVNKSSTHRHRKYVEIKTICRLLHYAGPLKAQDFSVSIKTYR